MAALEGRDLDVSREGRRDRSFSRDERDRRHSEDERRGRSDSRDLRHDDSYDNRRRDSGDFRGRRDSRDHSFDKSLDKDLEMDETKEVEEDNLQYRRDQNMMKHDPSTQPVSFFYLGISGHIESGEFRDLDGVSIKFDFVAGDHWKLSKGNESGISQHSFKS